MGESEVPVSKSACCTIPTADPQNPEIAAAAAAAAAAQAAAAAAAAAATVAAAAEAAAAAAESRYGCCMHGNGGLHRLSL